MDRKGISPLIAAVLLIAFVMAIGALFAEWANEMYLEGTDQNTERQDELLDCTGNTIEFLEVNEDYDSSEIEVVLQARGGNLGNISVTAYPSTETGYVYLDSDNAVGSTVLGVGEQQDSIMASSIPCDANFEEDLE